MDNALGTGRTALVAAGGVAALLGLYWDDAWHTDVGRDTFFAPPHLLLYAGVGLLLAVAVSWAWQRWRHEGVGALHDPVLALPLGGAAVTLAAAPVDELWHELFGRDAVVWSPPHMLAVAGLLAFAAGLLLIVAQGARRSPWLLTAVVGAFLIAAVDTVVMEFEADVPQFPVVLYLPVKVAATLFAFALIRRASGQRWAATSAAVVYTGLRVLVVGFLALLGHSLPTVMPTFAAAVVFDIAARRGWSRPALATAATMAAVASHELAHLVQPAGLSLTLLDIAAGAVVGTAAGWAALAAVGVGARGRPSRVRRATAVALVALAALGVAAPALAHDPGQGEEVAAVVLSATRHNGRIHLEVNAPASCQDWQPSRIVARRAGRELTAPLMDHGGCILRGHVDVDDPGRWFVYAEVELFGHLTETWLPVDEPHQTKTTVLYTAPQPGPTRGQVVAGVVLYLLVAGIVAGVVAVYRRLPEPAVTSLGVPRKVRR